jgi:hypothetical protein
MSKHGKAGRWTQPDVTPSKECGRSSMKKAEQKLTLDGPTSYQIQVPGELDARWSDWAAGMTLAVESGGDGLPVTTLTGTVDQAALQSVLRRLYSLGLPLISVTCVECGQDRR